MPIGPATMNPPTLAPTSLPLPAGARACRPWCALSQPNCDSEIAAAQRESLRAAFKHLFAGDGLPLFTLRDLRVTHTALGQPRVLRSGPLAAWGKEAGVKAEDLHVSFSHDGGQLATLFGWAPGLRGLGIDLVHLPRLARPGKDAEFLHRFADRCMSPDEYAEFAQALPDGGIEALRMRVALAFSLKEAASKALGTGLLLGLGLGKAQSVSLASLRVRWDGPAPRVEPVREAVAALRPIRATRVVCATGRVGECIVAEVAALR